ncbi:MAG TPA: sigma-70 family RNA polymerase sigma factor [Verrucomicrobiae bacterium]|jgi:RNA polymerase sigma-70 factor (ECF subfamily)
MEQIPRQNEASAGYDIKFIPTRDSLLSRLKNGQDQESWRSFFETYWRAVYGTARRAGLTDEEAQDVVQETVLSVFKSLQSGYDKGKGRFKFWLLRLIQRRIVDEFRKRMKGQVSLNAERSDGKGNEEDALQQIPDPAGCELEAVWEAEWENNLLEAALERVKQKVELKNYQIFDLHVCKSRSVTEVAQVMNVSPARVYLVKHRLQRILKQELETVGNGVGLK